MIPPLIYTSRQFSGIGNIDKVARNLPLLEAHAVGYVQSTTGAAEMGFLNHAFYPEVMSPARVPADPTAGTRWDTKASRWDAPASQSSPAQISQTAQP